HQHHHHHYRHQDLGAETQQDGFLQFAHDSTLRKILDAEHEVHFHLTFFGHGDFLSLRGHALMPRLKLVSAGRNVCDRVAALRVRHGEKLIGEHQHHTIHIGVDRTKHVHPTRILEGPALDGGMLVEVEVERIGFRHGKDVVKDIVVVRPFH